MSTKTTGGAPGRSCLSLCSRSASSTASIDDVLQDHLVALIDADDDVAKLRVTRRATDGNHLHGFRADREISDALVREHLWACCRQSLLHGRTIRANRQGGRKNDNAHGLVAEAGYLRIDAKSAIVHRQSRRHD